MCPKTNDQETECRLSVKGKDSLLKNYKKKLKKKMSLFWENVKIVQNFRLYERLSSQHAKLRGSRFADRNKVRITVGEYS